MGYHIHPTVAARLPPNARIADVGTGTGYFLFGIACKYPPGTGSLHGYDISPSFFPSKEETPANMEFSILDARKPIPAELEGTYDLVHMRLLSMGLLQSEWEPVVANLSRLLKPGGALQWEECDFLAATQHGTRPESTFKAVQTIENLLLDAFREHFCFGFKTLPEHMKAAGLVECGTDIVGTDRVKSTLAPLTENSMVACFQWARSGKDKVPFGKEELDQLEAQAYKDIESGGYVRWDVYVHWGFRPQ